MDPLDAVYEDVAAGKAKPPADYNQYKRLLGRARAKLKHDDVEERHKAVRVAAAVGGFRGLDIVRMFLADPEVTVRTRVVQVGIDAGEDGLPALRAAVADADPGVAKIALEKLSMCCDRGSATAARRMLKDASTELRVLAVTLLGNVAGRGLISQLRPLAGDDDPDLAAAATLAIDRIEGRAERTAPVLWWQRADQTDWAPPPSKPLPDPLPEDALSLFRALGDASPTDQETVTEALRAIPIRDLGFVVRDQPVDADPAVSRGMARASAALHVDAWVVPIRRMLVADDPAVRLEVAKALGVIGKGSVVMGLADLLKEGIPALRIAGANALGKLGRTAGVGLLAPLLTDPVPEVAAAARAATDRILTPPEADPTPADVPEAVPDDDGATLARQAPSSPDDTDTPPDEAAKNEDA